MTMIYFPNFWVTAIGIRPRFGAPACGNNRMVLCSKVAVAPSDKTRKTSPCLTCVCAPRIPAIREKIAQRRNIVSYNAAKAASTSSAWPSGFTFENTLAILPSFPMMNVVRATPMYFFPYMLFSAHTP